MNRSNLTPVRLRLILVGGMIALTGIAVGVFMVGYKQLTDYSVSSRSVAAQAQASNSSLQDLMTVKKELAANDDVVQRASLLVAESKSYLYQDQIIQDLNAFAASSGITITNISFTDAGSKTATATSTPAAGSGASTATSGSAAMTGGSAPSGIKTTTATITVKNPVEYTKMLTFIHSVEQSLFKMRISQVTLSKSSDTKNTDMVTTDALTIEVYLR